MILSEGVVVEVEEVVFLENVVPLQNGVAQVAMSAELIQHVLEIL